MSIELTKQQREVVDAPCGNLLISAAAGSGKTSVMTARIASRILSGELDVRNILVMTFTNAAAANMREKIEKQLADLSVSSKDPAVQRRLLEQISYLPLSHISTIHSFCLDVISNFGYNARTEGGEIIIEPGYSVLDEARKALLFRESADEVFTALYELSYRNTFTDQTAAQDFLKAASGETPEAAIETAPLAALLAAPEETAKAGLSMLDKVPSERNKDSKEILPFSLLSGEISVKDWLLDFNRMVSSLGNPRSDEPVRELIGEFHSYLRSLPFYEDWIREKLTEMKAASVCFEDTNNARALMKDFYTSIDLALPNLPVLRKLLPETVFVKAKKGNDEYMAFFGDLLDFFDRICQEYLQKSLTWDRCVQYAACVPEGKFPSVSKTSDPATAQFWALLAPFQEVLYSFTGKCKKAVMDLFRTPARHLFGRTLTELQEELAYMFPVAERLYEVLLLIDDRFAQKKRAENAIDFSDYEHLALLLLSGADASKYYSDLFSEIYIDEYQDNSRIQDAIVSSFSRNNCFVVGDVKQSIYRFRHARPEMFMSRMKTYREEEQGTLLELNSNFRSRPGILALVNDIFSQILSEESGEIEYNDDHRLFPQREADIENGESVPVELILIDVTAGSAGSSGSAISSGSTGSAGSSVTSGSGEMSETAEEGSEDALFDPSEFDKTKKEAMAVALKILGIMSEKKAKYGDFAVLTRTNKEAAVIRDMLVQSGIPAEGPSEEAFLSSRELLLMENLMRLLDNFRQDIPLAAVMRAPFRNAGFQAQEILDIYLFAREKELCTEYFHEKVLYYREYGEDKKLKDSVCRFCDWIDSLRSRSMYLRVSELIEQIYVETGYLEQVVCLADGPRRVLALETFRDWANNFESKRSAGLYRFVKYIEDIRNQKQSPEDFEIFASERDVVHCMSIHKSKGLEFAYVFLAGIQKSLFGAKKRRNIIMSEKLGIGIDYIRPDIGYWYPTHQMLALEAEDKKVQLAEYMRVFYVAMTRAEERLFLVGCIARNKDQGLGRSSSLITNTFLEKGEKLPAWLIMKAKSYLDFSLLGLARNSSVPMQLLLSEEDELQSYESVPDSVLKERTRSVRLDILDENEVMKEYITSASYDREPDGAKKPSYILGEVPEPVSGEDDALFKTQIFGVYPYESQTKHPAKMTVSEIKRLVQDYSEVPEEGEEGAAFSADAAAGFPTQQRRPVNLMPLSIEAITEQKNEEMPPAKRGTLLHSVFQYLDFPSILSDPGTDRIEKAVNDLISHSMIGSEMKKHLISYYPAIDRFAASGICARMVFAETGKGTGPFREIPFTITEPAGKGDVSLVQGMIDCWFIEEGGAVLIDYKSDSIAGNLAEKARILSDRYRIQLDYYARAIEAVCGLKVKERIIWLIPDGISFLIEGCEKNL